MSGGVCKLKFDWNHRATRNFMPLCRHPSLLGHVFTFSAATDILIYIYIGLENIHHQRWDSLLPQSIHCSIGCFPLNSASRENLTAPPGIETYAKKGLGHVSVCGDLVAVKVWVQINWNGAAHHYSFCVPTTADQSTRYPTA